MKKDFFKEYGFRIIFIVVFLLAFVWMGTKQTIRSNSNSVEDWLPPQYQQTRDYKWYLEHFPFESYVVVSWEGCTLDDEDRIELFAQKLVPGQTIDNYSLMGVSPKLKAELDLKEVPERVTQEINRLAAGQERTLESGADADTESVRGARTTEASPETKEEPAYFKSVMTGPRLIRLLEQTYAKVQSRQSPEEIHQEIINRLKGTLIGPDGRSTALIITLNKGKRDGKSLKLVLNKIREISLECGLPDTTEVVTGSLVDRMVKNLTDMFREIAYGRTVRMDGIIMGGPPVDNVALDQEGVRTLYRLAGICAFIGVSIAFICLRSIRLTMFVFWIAILSAGVALAIVSLTGGTCDSILLSMPALVYVLAMSGSVHLINYYHDTIREQGLQGATEQAVRHAFPPCFFAQLTTAIGLGSLFVGRLVPITKFGFYSAIGVLITLLLLFFYLPALLYFYPSKKFAAKYGGTGLHNKNETISTFWSYYGRFIVKYHNLVALVCLIIMGFFAYYLPSIKTSVKMMSFFSSDAEIIKHYDWLEGKLGPLVPMETVISFDNSKLDPSTFGVAERLRLMNTISQQLTEKLSEDVGGTLSAATFAPDVEMFGRPGSIYYRMASAVIGKAVDENRESLKDYITIEGNPSLDEMDRYLTQKAEKVLKEYEQKKNALNERLQAKGMTLDEIQILSTRESRSEAETEILDEFTADIQDFEEIANKSLQLEGICQTFNNRKELLRSSGIVDLETLFALLPENRAFKTLTLEETEAFHKGAGLWQQDCGIELWRLSIRVWSLKKDIDYSAFIENVRNVIEPILAEKSAEILGEEYVPAELPDQKANKRFDWTFGMRTTEDDTPPVADPELQNSMGEAHNRDIIYPAGLSAKYTGMVPLVYKTQHELIKGLCSSLVMAFFLIAIVFMIILRSVCSGILVMIPNLFPVVVVFGFMAWMGILVDVGTMMTASVALGVAVDDTMHYLTWFSESINRGKTPGEAAVTAYQRCATAMTQSTLIAGLGLFAFAFSTFIPTQRFGILMLSILFVALVGDLVLLPSILTGPFGRFFLKYRKPRERDRVKSA